MKPEITIEEKPIINSEQEEDILKFKEQLSLYRSGELDPEVFRVFRLSNGIYGQRQGEEHQMVRIKIPAGSLNYEQLYMLGHIAEKYSRGWGHITTRQNIQFHFVQLDDVIDLLIDLASVGLTTREACGDTVRNVQGCHLAGACPYEIFDITHWATATYSHFIRNPIAQRLPRKFKINFSGCSTDCGQAMFNDIGIIAVNEEKTNKAGFRIFVAGGLGSNPHPALAIEEFTEKENLLPTLESCVRVFNNYGNRDNKLRARMKWLVDSLGFEDLQNKIFKERKFLLASSSWAGGIPKEVMENGDKPAGKDSNIEATKMGQGTIVNLSNSGDFNRWESANVVRGSANGTVSAYAWCELGDITTKQFVGLADIQKEFLLEVRITNRQNLVFRNIKENQLKLIFQKLQDLKMAEAGVELARDVVSCPGADTCNLAITQSRGLAGAIGDKLESDGLADIGGVRINISGCTNSCGQHHAFDIGFFGIERRANGLSAPGYQMLLGGYVGNQKINFAKKVLRLPAKNIPKAVSKIIQKYSTEREFGEAFHLWLERIGGVDKMKVELSALDNFPAPDEAPDFYVDYDESTPYQVKVGDSECAT